MRATKGQAAHIARVSHTSRILKGSSAWWAVWRKRHIPTRRRLVHLLAACPCIPLLPWRGWGHTDGRVACRGTNHGTFLVKGGENGVGAERPGNDRMHRFAFSSGTQPRSVFMTLPVPSNPLSLGVYVMHREASKQGKLAENGGTGSWEDENQAPPIPPKPKAMNPQSKPFVFNPNARSFVPPGGAAPAPPPPPANVVPPTPPPVQGECCD